MHIQLTANKLGALSMALQDLVSSALGEQGQTDATALVTVLYRGPISIGGLAEIIRLSHAATVRVADRLEQVQLVRRKQKDGRKVHLVLSAKGRKKAHAIQSKRLEGLSSALERLPRDEAADFDRIISHLLGVLVKDRRHARQICRMCDHGLCSNAVCPAGKAADLIEGRYP